MSLFVFGRPSYHYSIVEELIYLVSQEVEEELFFFNAQTYHNPNSNITLLTEKIKAYTMLKWPSLLKMLGDLAFKSTWWLLSTTVFHQLLLWGMWMDSVINRP